MITQFQADPAEAGTRLDVFLAGAMAEIKTERQFLSENLSRLSMEVFSSGAGAEKGLGSLSSVVLDVPSSCTCPVGVPVNAWVSKSSISS